MANVSNYDHYQELKGWDSAPFMLPSPADILFYEYYLGKIPISGAKVLEVGFGNGNFIGWARQRGATVYGTELQTIAVEKALEKGVDVLPVDIASSVENLREKLTVIAALDVMEHLSLKQNMSLLASASAMLQIGGILLLRFPNGQSPLSLPAQYGDVSHISVMSVDIVKQLIINLPFSVIYSGAPFRPLTGGVTSRMARHIQAALRRGVDRIIRSLYGDVSMDMNAVMVMRRI